MKHELIWALLIGWSVLHGMERATPHAGTSTISKKRKEIGSSQSSLQTHQKILANLPDAMQQYILGFLSSGIHTWDMYDKSRTAYQNANAERKKTADLLPWHNFPYPQAVTNWCNFSLLSKRSRQNAHRWAQLHFGITESDYKLFVQVQKVRHIAGNILRTARESGEIGFFDRADLLTSRPYCGEPAKEGMILVEGSYIDLGLNETSPILALRLPQLQTKWGTISLFPTITSDVDDMGIILSKRLKAAYDLEKIEQGQPYQPRERYTHTTVAIRIMWNILSARYAQEGLGV